MLKKTSFGQNKQKMHSFFSCELQLITLLLELAILS